MLSHLVGFLRGYNATPDEEWFEQLARKHLPPEEAQEVMEQGNGWNRIMRFAELFSQEYFPLDDMYLQSRAESVMEGDWDDEDNLQNIPYSLMRDGIPFNLVGYIWDDTHELWDEIRPGMAAMVMLARAPYITYSSYALEEEYEGMRQAWLEAAADHIPQETLKQIPKGGIPMEILEEALRETPLEAVHLEAMWMYSCTDNFFLDYTIDDEMFNGFSDPWDDDVIEDAQQRWKEARVIIEKTSTLKQWLEEDLAPRFRQMLDYTLERVASIPENFRKRDE